MTVKTACRGGDIQTGYVDGVTVGSAASGAAIAVIGFAGGLEGSMTSITAIAGDRCPRGRIYIHQVTGIAVTVAIQAAA